MNCKSFRASGILFSLPNCYECNILLKAKYIPLIHPKSSKEPFKLPQCNSIQLCTWFNKQWTRGAGPHLIPQETAWLPRAHVRFCEHAQTDLKQLACASLCEGILYVCILACLFRARPLLNTCFNAVNCWHVHTDPDRYYENGVMGRQV